MTRPLRFISGKDGGPAFRQRASAQIAATTILAVGAIGMFTMTQNNLLPVDAIMLGIVGLVVLSARLTTSILRLVVASAIGLYAAIHILLSIPSQAQFADIGQAHKWLIFLALLLLTGAGGSSVSPFLFALRGLIVENALKALYLFFANPGSRLGVLAETNFEITMYCMLLAVCWKHLRRERFVWLVILACCTLASASRSAAVAFAILVVYVALVEPITNGWLRVIRPIVITAAIIVPFLVFADRGGDVRTSDRARFLQLFLEATQTWTPLQWLFGAAPITPLPSNICYSLTYYSTLFASDDATHCYSVILHIFVLRVLYDFGLLGLVVATILPFFVLKSAGVRPSLSIALSLMAVTNGLSVSGVNSEYVILPLAAAISIASLDLRPTPTRLGKIRMKVAG